MASIIIKKCKANCKHEYQDKKYDGKRVMNIGLKYSKCTVCGEKH